MKKNYNYDKFIKTLTFKNSLKPILLFFSTCVLLSCSNEEIEYQESLSSKIAMNRTISKIVPQSVSANGDDGNIPENTLDGSLSTRWSSKGYNGKYITYDLGSVKSISSVKLAWYAGNHRKAYFKIRVGNSIYDLQTVVNRKNTGSSGTTTGLETYNFDSVEARYIRISCFGNSNSPWNSITETEIYGNESQNNTGDENQNASPGTILGITTNSWKLNGFTGTPGPGATYEDNVLSATGTNFTNYNDTNYFYTDGDWTYFKCYRGLGGSVNSGNPRVELRELKNGQLSNWDGDQGNNTMTFTVKVDRLPEDADTNGGILCFAQIHGPSNTVDDVIRVQFKGEENQSSGTVRLKISGYITEEVLNGSITLNRNYELGASYTFTLTYNDGIVTLLEGSEEIFSQAIGTITSGNYFKVGNYLQSVQGANYNGSYGLVGIKNLSITH